MSRLFANSSRRVAVKHSNRRPTTHELIAFNIATASTAIRLGRFKSSTPLSPAKPKTCRVSRFPVYGHCDVSSLRVPHKSRFTEAGHGQLELKASCGALVQ
ncbi:hypothetical protein BaRGS_00007642 [Batillaria attramentaria]|uniref:Uncharacterized protein n=1 Tax=Batillaria attramentaria TaxID=370345 RepID=A0ABD0LP90_9CAEN